MKHLSLNKKNKVIPFVLALLVVILPNMAHAGIDATIWAITTGIGGIFTYIGGLALDYSISLLILGMGDLLLGNIGFAVNNMWVIIRDICNLVFIFSLIYIGIRTILFTNDSSTQKQLGLLIVAALLINFSLLITKTVIDFSNIVAVQIYEQINITGDYRVEGYGQEVNGIGGAFMNEMQLETFFDKDGLMKKISATEGAVGTGKVFVFGLFAMIIMMIAGVVFLAGAFMIIKRFILLIFFMIFSPLMFAGLIFPKFQGLQSKWWDGFLRNAFIAPAYIFMLYLSLAVTRNINSGSFSELYNPESAGSGAFAVFIYFFIVAGFLVGSLIVAGKMGDATATATLGGLKSAGKAVQGNLQSFAGRNTIGRFGDWALRKSEQAEGTRTGRNIKRALTAATLGTFDDRARKAAFKQASDATFGGSRSRSNTIKYNEETEKIRARESGKISLRSAVEVGSSRSATDTQRIAMEQAIKDASGGDLVELAKSKDGRQALAAVAGNLSTSQFEAIMKSDDLSGSDKAEIASGRRLNAEATLTPSGGSLSDGIADANKDQLRALNLETLMNNAQYLQDSQMDNLKPENGILSQTQFKLLKDKRKQDIINWATTAGSTAGAVALLKSRKGEKEIAKLPREVLVHPNFVMAAATNNQLSTSLLAKIATDSDLAGPDKATIKANIATMHGGTLKSPYKEWFDTPLGQTHYS